MLGGASTDGLTEPPAPKRSKRPRPEADASDGGSNGRMRHRVSRACNECRRRKDRCDGRRPSCASCVNGGRYCTYGPFKKRGLRTGYVRALEILLGLVLSTIEESETWICGLLQGTSEPVTFRPKHPHAYGQREDVVETMLENWRKGAVMARIEQMLAPSESPDDEDDGADSTKHFDVRIAEALALAQRDAQLTVVCNSGAPLSPIDTDIAPKVATSLNPQGTPKSSPLPFESSDVEELSQTSTYILPSHPSPRVQSKEPPTPQLPSNWPYLLDVYFTTTHCWFPISQKHELLRIAYTLSNNPTTTAPLSGVPQGDLAFLHAVISYASHQVSSMSNPVHSGLDSNNRDPSEKCQALYQSPIFKDPRNYDIGHIRALLMFSLLEVDLGHWTDAWVAIGRAIYTAVSLGLLPRQVHGPEPFQDGIKRTLLGCVMLESLIATHLDTRPYFQPPIITSIGLLHVEGLEEWEPWQPKVRLSSGGNTSGVGPCLRTPGLVVSTFNRSLEIMGLLSQAFRDRNSNEPNQDLSRNIRDRQKLLGILNELRDDAEMPPQIFNIQFASVSVFEALAAEHLSLCGIHVERPYGYWNKAIRLVRSLEERVQTMGRCCVPPTLEIYAGVLQQSLDNQRQHHIQSGFGEQVQLVTGTLSGWLASWRRVGLPGTQTAVDSENLARPSAPTQDTDMPIVASAGQASPRPGKLVSLDVRTNAPLPSDQQDFSKALQGTALAAESAQGSTINPTLSIARAQQLDDDGLFDSLATLDSADWLANTPEFMQNLGVLGDPTANLELLFDVDL
ncbi:hypothetical protein FDECE_5604 [Fusarium decemcellulare]|nr:hypothetical protein FDECE_5604 [Fusarium decemcellulare]